MKRHRRTTYELLSVTPVSGLLAVMNDDWTVPGKLSLFTIPLVAIGLAEVVEETYEALDSKPGDAYRTPKLLETEQQPNEVVGVILCEGSFEIAAHGGTKFDHRPSPSCL